MPVVFSALTTKTMIGSDVSKYNYYCLHLAALVFDLSN
jgi:hypothetical protein